MDPCPAADILVVDDVPANLTLLCGILKEQGYRARPAPDGAMALRAAAQSRPDLVLLDIDMPGLDGFEVCRRLKADPALADIPVLFISALADVTDKVRGLALGGVDYISKPFRAEEVLARVQVQLTLRRQRQELEESNQRLRELESLRDSLVHMLVHDLRTPLAVLTTNLEWITWEEATLPPAQHEGVADALAAAWRMVGMVDAMLDLSRLEATRMPLDLAACDLAELGREVLASLAPLARGRTLTLQAPPAPLIAMADRVLLSRVLQNLVTNALKFTPRPGCVALSVEAGEACVRLCVADEGPGIAPEHQDLIFEKYGQVHDPALRTAASPGLGLAFCRLAVEAHGGRIGVHSALGQGARFWIELPRP